MIKVLKFANFRGFTELKIAPLQRINLIAGANNTGKTGILEGLYLLLNNPQEFAQLPSVFRSSSNPIAAQTSADNYITFWQSLIHDREFKLAAMIAAEDGTVGPGRSAFHSRYAE
jgi:AAA15 family ATPase/GTPase